MTGACRPASRPTSTKRAWKGRPEGADFGNGLALCVESPCARSPLLPRENAVPIPNCANLRRVIFIGRRSPRNSCVSRTNSSRAPLLVHLNCNLLLRLGAALSYADVNFVCAWREFIRRQVRDVRNSSVLLHVRQRRLCRAEVLSFLVEGHGELKSILSGAIWIHSKVERQNISGTALERARKSGHDLATGEIECIQDLIAVFQGVSPTYYDHLTHGQLAGGLWDRDGALDYSDLAAVSVH